MSIMYMYMYVIEDVQTKTYGVHCKCRNRLVTTCTCTVAQLVELAEGRGFKSHQRQQFFFERLLPWDLICISFLCLSQVSEYLSCV